MEDRTGLQSHPEKLSLDSLFDAEISARDCQTLVYQQVLARVHKRIRVAARNWKRGRFCFFLIPELIIGVPRYNTVECTKYLMSTLQRNGFVVSYTFPNLLLVSWEHYINSRDREAIRRATGVRVDGYGKALDAGDSSQTRGGSRDTTSASGHVPRPPPSVYSAELLLGTRGHPDAKN
jgi:hypothetical protein